MNKFLLIISFVLISLLAVGAVSAAEGTNATDDSTIQSASLDIQEQTVVEDDSIIKTENQPEEILSDGKEKETPKIDVENITVEQYKTPIIPFNVTDSNGNPVSGDVIVTIGDEGDDISKYVVLYNGNGTDSFIKLDLKKLEEYNKGLNALDASNIYNFVYSSMNSSKFNPKLIGEGFTDIYKGINLNVSQLIHDIVEMKIIDFSKIGEKLKNLIFDFDPSNLSILFDLTKAVSINRTAFYDSLEYTLTGLNMSSDEDFSFIDEFLSYLDLNVSDEIIGELMDLLLEENINLHGLIKIVVDVYNNNLTMERIVDAMNHASNGTSFNLSIIIEKLVHADPAKLSILKEGLSRMLKSVSINFTEAIDILENSTKGFTFNITKISNAVSDIIGVNASKVEAVLDGIGDIINGVAFNKTYTKKWIVDLLEGNTTNILNRIFNVSQMNTSAIKSGFDKIIPAINFKYSGFLTVSAVLNYYGKFNSSLILGGLDKVVQGLGGDVSDVISKIFSRIGYSAVFPNEIKKPGVYNITVKYLGNDVYNSTIARAILNITPFEAHVIRVYMVELPEKYGDDAILYVFLEDGFEKGISGVVDVYVNGKMIGSVNTDVSGFARVPIANMASGRYSIRFEYKDAYAEIDVGISVLPVASKIVSSNLKTVTVNTKVDGKIGKYFKVTLKDANGKVLSNREILIGFNGKTYRLQTDKNGVAKMQMNIKKAGTYGISACFLGDAVYGASYATAKVTVKKQTAKLTAKKKTFRAKAKKKTVSAKFVSAKGHAINGKKIKFTVKGKTYSAKTNKKGIASVNLKLTKKGTYNVAVKFAGDTMYNKLTKKISVKIK